MSAVSSRYARAFAEIAVKHKLEADKVSDRLSQMAQLVNSNAELRNVWQNPAVEHEQKLKLLDAIMRRLGGDKLLRNFVAVLIDHHRIAQLEEIAEQFKRELDERLGIAEAQVISARELTAEERRLLEKQMAAITKKAVRATYSLDRNLLGGAVVRIGSTIYDGSVQGQLQRIRQQIASS